MDRKLFIISAVIVSFLVFVSFIGSIVFKDYVDYDFRQEKQEEEKKSHQVSRVIDGDTIELQGGVLVLVRYLAIDAPELDQPFGRVASEFNKQLVLGKQIRLEYDNVRLDDYGRLLAYVWVDDVLVNERLVEEGYARVSYIPTEQKPKYLGRLKKAQEKAKSLNKGLWDENN